MQLLVFKGVMTPICIGFVTLAGRYWGPVVSGLLMGLPLTSGPISLIVAHEQGLIFATKAAVGNIVGQIICCIFCLSYSLASKKCNWHTSVSISLVLYLLSAIVCHYISWAFISALMVLLFFVVISGWQIPQKPLPLKISIPPRWDLPARMFVATSVVIIITASASKLGPQLSGMLSTFPAFAVVFAAFNHSQQGPVAASNMLRGVVLGTFANLAFFAVVGVFLLNIGIALTYAIATISALLVSYLVYCFTRNKFRYSPSSCD